MGQSGTLTYEKSCTQGCNIELYRMPSIAKIDLVIDPKPVACDLVREKWQSAQSLLKTDVTKRGLSQMF